MAFVRTFSFVVPVERLQEMQPGHNLYMATVDGTQIVAQNSEGYLYGSVLSRLQPDGSLKVVIYTQWAAISSIERYVRTPMIQDYEADVARYHGPPVIEIFELLA
jgi:hypothetical protein